MNSVLFHDLAARELLDAREYYDDLVFGLGKKFVIEIERCIKIIKANPLANPIIRDNIRKAVVIKFPYSILYRVEKNIVYILAVMHQKKEPKYWTKRM